MEMLLLYSYIIFLGVLFWYIYYIYKFYNPNDIIFYIILYILKKING